ncbi:Long-chain-fatty-acid--luciferin-component ligase [Labilithrix luteola]|uniref:Long-chain-fatty-acid--luciferin-component ligase n=1 Tax=Labilithrix luteola TaxID=1391654 RepID=A0A0K1PYG8_9BACT|nr:acyl-protein synthetase [Labilithrix luteola]AKU98575.1 Long-chain-fatty-acid--luciferin-component ligase [Labilithrix luteola]
MDSASRSARLARSTALHERARALVSAYEKEAPAPESLDSLACDLARFQAESIEGYARLCKARGVDPASLSRAEDIPAVPTDAFKLTRVATFEPEETRAVFRTSGTTQGKETRGEHAMRDPSTYDVAAVAFGRQWLVRDFARDGKKVPVVVLSPPPSIASDSSLVHMCAAFVEAFGTNPGAEATYVIDGEVIDLGGFDERVAGALTRNQPMLVLGTSFAFVHLLDALGDDTFPLPPGTRVMQTGGYKGKSREVPPEVLRRELARVFAIDERAILAEYGMTELSSQFYEKTLFEPESKKGVFAEPPWARVIPVDPETLVPVADGEIGIAKIIDTMNVDSAVAVLTQDRVRRVAEGGFEVLGRAPGAPPRGCSIAIDELLGREGTS